MEWTNKFLVKTLHDIVVLSHQVSEAFDILQEVCGAWEENPDEEEGGSTASDGERGLLYF